MNPVNHTLAVVGSGINGVEHMTSAARAWIQTADRVVYVVDTLTECILKKLNPAAESLQPLYDADENRQVSYKLMVNVILGYLNMHPTVCAVFYGHPGVFVNPSHEAIRIARRLGFDAFMIPGISAEDCLFADLQVDPAAVGCQSYEATDFLARQRIIDPTAALVLWQIDVLGELTGKPMETANYQARHLDVLAEVLSGFYGPHHEVTLYDAAIFPLGKPGIIRVPLSALPQTPLMGASTMYVPPRGPVRLDTAMMKRLGLPLKPEPT